MAQITKLLTSLPWYGPALTISSAPWLGSVDFVRIVNSGGTGYISYQSGQPFNSYTTINPGDLITVQAKSSATSGGGFALDNGTAPVDSTKLVATFPANLLSTVSLVIGSSEAGNYNLLTASGTGATLTGLSGIGYTRNGTALSGVTALSAGDTVLVTGTAGSVDGVLTLIKQ